MFVQVLRLPRRHEEVVALRAIIRVEAVVRRGHGVEGDRVVPEPGEHLLSDRRIQVFERIPQGIVSPRRTLAVVTVALRMKTCPRTNA